VAHINRLEGSGSQMGVRLGHAKVLQEVHEFLNVFIMKF